MPKPASDLYDYRPQVLACQMPQRVHILLVPTDRTGAVRGVGLSVEAIVVLCAAVFPGAA